MHGNDNESVRLIAAASCTIDVLCGHGLRMLSSVRREIRRSCCKWNVNEMSIQTLIHGKS
jgi:hypothetical protein